MWGKKVESEANFAERLFQFSSTVNRGSDGPVCVSEAGQMSSSLFRFFLSASVVVENIIIS